MVDVGMTKKVHGDEPRFHEVWLNPGSVAMSMKGRGHGGRRRRLRISWWKRCGARWWHAADRGQCKRQGLRNFYGGSW